MNEFRFEWTQDTRLIAVSVVGAKLSLKDARSVALKVGAG
jgi:hypothetical protein